ncbi:response regulator [Paenibacillus harenae]|uniref:Transcriptional regulatory protein n=1 Tax=Paenibacillus harenae TaxID=306543 RepID=A0ABT9UD59_PAEHA|nr:response regulator [Paenibacillus harenae]MDQ0116605.1 two-component system response regulator DctR [Paenibacillus harenae]
METIRVLLIEDDPMVQEVNRQFVEGVDGFLVIGTAASGSEGLRLIYDLSPDLVILDIFMPGLDGIGLLQRVREEQLEVDVIVISAANDIATIGRMLQNGAVDYIMKPFKFERVKQALERYRSKKNSLGSSKAVTQNELDLVLFGEHTASASEPASETLPAAQAGLPKGMQAATLRHILKFLETQPKPVSAEETAEAVGIARVTARRYLEYLEKTGSVRLELQYGVGRPLNTYLYADTGL